MDKKTTHSLKGITGTIVSTKMKGTVIVEVERLWHHPTYKKAVKRNKRIAADSVGVEVTPGDKVRIVAVRPISKIKHYKVVEKL